MLNMTSKEAYHKVLDSGKRLPWERLPELELVIQQDAWYAYLYAKYVLKGRWIKAEPIIQQDAESAYEYATEILKSRWPEAEPVIQQNAKWAYLYAIKVIKGRFEEAEPVIKQDAKMAYFYASDVIKGRWLEAEEIIAQSEYKSRYVSLFFSEPVITKDQCSYFEWKKVGDEGFFAPERLFEIERKESLIDIMIDNLSQC